MSEDFMEPSREVFAGFSYEGSVADLPTVWDLVDRLPSKVKFIGTSNNAGDRLFYSRALELINPYTMESGTEFFVKDREKGYLSFTKTGKPIWGNNYMVCTCFGGPNFLIRSTYATKIVCITTLAKVFVCAVPFTLEIPKG